MEGFPLRSCWGLPVCRVGPESVVCVGVICCPARWCRGGGWNGAEWRGRSGQGTVRTNGDMPAGDCWRNLHVATGGLQIEPLAAVVRHRDPPTAGEDGQHPAVSAPSTPIHRRRIPPGSHCMYKPCKTRNNPPLSRTVATHRFPDHPDCLRRADRGASRGPPAPLRWQGQPVHSAHPRSRRELHTLRRAIARTLRVHRAAHRLLAGAVGARDPAIVPRRPRDPGSHGDNVP